MGLTRFDVVQASAFIGSQYLTQGKSYFVRPRTGLDGNSGLSPQKALKTLAAALAKCVANQNDCVFLIAEGNASGNTAGTYWTTDYQSATLDWNKDLVHLIGVNLAGGIAGRARIAFLSTYATASNLFTVSANGCRIENIHAFAGVADTSPVGCCKVTGTRNKFINCHLAGIGNDANDIAGAYSLRLSGAAENQFYNCEIGLDTIARGTGANSEILVDTIAARNYFEDCRIYALIEHASNHPLVKLAAATSIDRTLHFKNCAFINESVNYGIAQAGVFKLVADLTQGFILLENCWTNPSDASTAPKWDVDDRNKICIINSPTPAADTVGVGRMV